MSSIPSDAKKFDEFKVKFLFSIRPKTAEISPEKSVQWRIQAEKCITTPVVYNGSSRSRRQTHKWVGSGLCCPEKNPEVFNKGGTRAKNGAIGGIRRTAYRKKLYYETVVQWKIDTPKVCLLMVSTHQMSRTSNGGIQIPSKFWVPEIYFIRSFWRRKIRWI